MDANSVCHLLRCVLAPIVLFAGGLLFPVALPRALAQDFPGPEDPPTLFAGGGVIDVLPDESIYINIYGYNLREDTRITIAGAGDLIDPFFHSEQLISGYTPTLPPGDPNFPTGWKDVVASDARGSTTLEHAVLYVDFGAVYLKHLFPSELPLEAGTRVQFIGRNFRAGLQPYIDGGLCTDVVLESDTILSCTAPDIAPSPEPTDRDLRGSSIHDSATDEVLSSRDSTVLVVPGTRPARITAVIPRELRARGGTLLEIRGESFRGPEVLLDPTNVVITGAGTLEGQELVSSTLIRGVAPAVDPFFQGALAPRSVLVLDQRGQHVFEESIVYVDQIRRVTPSEVAASGGTLMTFDGFGFEEGWTLRIGGQALSPQSRINDTRWQGAAPPLAPGVYDADFVSDDGSVVGFLPTAVTVVPSPVSLTRVEPPEVTLDGGVALTFVGSGFFPGLEARLGGLPLLSPAFVDGERLAGFVPDLGALELSTGARLRAEVVDGSGNVVASLEDAVKVVSDEPVDELSISGPDQVEGALAEGEARFFWNNPIEAEEIIVRDESGLVLQRLSGTTNFLKLPLAPGVDFLKVTLESKFAGGAVSSRVEGVARRAGCKWPPPLTGIDLEGPANLTVYGGSFQAPPPRCAAAPEPTWIPDLVAVGLKDVRSAGGTAFYRAGSAGGGDVALKFGAVITSEVRERFEILEPLFPGIVERYTKHLVTGFTLAQDADKLQFDARYRLAVPAEGLKLKARLIHVFPADGFVDEFTFPALPTGFDERTFGVTYYRADRDVADSEARPCDMKIPAGDYLMDIYAEGGDPNTPHYIFESDGRNEELFIPGVPCPPYPRIRITDLTGQRSLPVISHLLGQQVAKPTASLPYSRVQFKAVGYWLDEHNRPHSLDPADINSTSRPYVPYDFGFRWGVGSEEPPIAVEAAGTNSVIVTMKTVGCYEVRLAISDPDCPRQTHHTEEVAVFPLEWQCKPGALFSALNPIPNPSSIWAVGGFRNVPSTNGVPPRRTAAFTVFVVPEGCCNGGLNCPAPKIDDLEYRLAFAGQPVYTVTSVTDLCENRTTGPKYFKVGVVLDNVDLIPAAQNGAFVDVFLQARPSRAKYGERPWNNVGPPLHITNRPELLAKSYWTATYSKDDSSYHFILQSSKDAVHRFDKISNTNPKQIFGDIAGSLIPPFPSSVDAALNTGLSIAGAAGWKPEKALQDLHGKLLGNQLEANPAGVAVSEIIDGVEEKLEWGWSDRQTLFSKQFQQKLFESIIWSGVIVVVPVTIWGSVSLGLDVNIEAGARVKVAPFQALLSGNYFESDLDFTSKLGISLPAQLRADILFGVVSHAIEPKIQADSGFTASLRVRNTNVDSYLRLFVMLDMQILTKICAFWYLCYPTFIVPVLNDFELINYEKKLGSGGGGEIDGGPASPAGGGGLDVGPPGALPGGGAVDTFKLYEELTNPVIVASPDGNAAITLAYYSKRQALEGSYNTLAVDAHGDLVTKKTGMVVWPAELKKGGPYDLALAFLSNHRAIVLSRATYPEESAVAFPLPVGKLPNREELNELHAQDEIVLFHVNEKGPNAWDIDPPAIRISDPKDETAPADRRSDGKPALAASTVHQDAIAAWIRVEAREYLIEEPTQTTVYDTHEVPGDVISTPGSLPTVRPQLEACAIYTRRVNFDGVLDAPRKISAGGINVEPVIAFSPSGNTAYCVWVNDSLHKDLVTSNRGRNLLYSVWRRSTDSWSAPAEVIADASRYPGVLEPSIVLKSDTSGFLAFNALPADAPERDTGLNGNNRFVYLCRLDGGAFGAPVRVHGYCGARVLGRYQVVQIPKKLVVPPLGKKPPEVVIIFQQTGGWGLPESSGNVMIAALAEGATEPSPAVSLTNDNRLHTNVVGTLWNGGAATINLKGPVALAEAGGGGIVGDEGYELIEAALEPDLAVSLCKLSDQFPGAGARVRATVEIENRGLASSAEDSLGRSACGVQLIYRRADGTETVEAQSTLPILAPGEKTSLEFEIEMPLDPVRLRAEITPNPFDRDRSNDVTTCFFGAPEPRDFACKVFVPNRVIDPAGEAALAVELSWTNPALYDEVSVFRDGSQLAALPGASAGFVDQAAPEGLHVYEVRSRVGVSKSCRVRLECLVEPPGPTDGNLRRGDVDSSGSIDITDAIGLLGSLFLGVAEPACPDAADADDSGQLDITDAIGILGFLFTGGAAPRAPGPDACGADPTDDALGPCGGICR